MGPARSQLYAVLKRLAAAGLVSGRHVEQADRRRARERLATFRDIERTLDGDEAADACGRLRTLRLGIALTEATPAWADETLAALAPAAEEARPG